MVWGSQVAYSRPVEKRGSLVGFPGPPTYRDEYIPIYILMFLTGQYIEVYVVIARR